MSTRLLSEQIVKPIPQANFFTLMCDETADISNKEQAAICIRTVDKNLDICEDFIGLHELECTKSDYIFKVLTTWAPTDLNS